MGKQIEIILNMPKKRNRPNTAHKLMNQ